MREWETLEKYKKYSRLDELVTYILLLLPLIFICIGFYVMAKMDYDTDCQYQPRRVMMQEQLLSKAVSRDVP